MLQQDLTKMRREVNKGGSSYGSTIPGAIYRSSPLCYLKYSQYSTNVYILDEKYSHDTLVTLKLCLIPIQSRNLGSDGWRLTHHHRLDSSIEPCRLVQGYHLDAVVGVYVLAGLLIVDPHKAQSFMKSFLNRQE